MLRFEWDAGKAWSNAEKHHVSFEAAALIFDDPNILSALDRRFDYGEEERWLSMGMAAGLVVLLVAHTVKEGDDGEEVIRIISARKATRAERRRYARRDA